jgi:LytS/YehU family sensor histidine kinase
MGFVSLAVILVKQRQKALVELSKKASLQLEIKAIHAQFNPHFVFNALNSIQGLINKEDIAGANKYLSVFGQLMRNSLANSDKNLISLSEEIDILETYLKLEQLRFGFTYKVEVSKDINVYETEIPSLLLQPLIENAIKHGISGLRENGIIDLSFKRDSNDMLVTLTDNGKGFLLQEKSGGYGLKLTVERIKLMNRVLKGQSIQFEIKASLGSPTKVYLIFSNWFL